MSYYTAVYYSKNTNGKIIRWFGKVDDSGTITIKTGLLKGSEREIVNTNIKGKNIGKSNSTSKYTQAVKELKAKVSKKKKQGYKTIGMIGGDATILDLHSSRLYEYLDTRLSINKTDSNNILKPMKAKPWQSNKFKYPAICQPKINGHRTVAILIKDLEGMFATGDIKVKLLTKEGHEYILPHIVNSLSIELLNEVNFDGEVYVHNEILSNIKRRLPIKKIGSHKVSKPSLSPLAVKYYIFDLSIPDVGQKDRLKLKDELLKDNDFIYYDTTTNQYGYFDNHNSNNSVVVNVLHTIINSDKEAYQMLNAALKFGFEGVVLRTLDDEYHFGSRKINMMKLKGLKHSEFKILDVILKNEDNVRTYVSFKCKNDINDKTFEVTAQGSEIDRQNYINNPDKYIGKLVTLGFGERTINGLPFHIKEVNIRDSWDMDKNDLNIEI